MSDSVREYLQKAIQNNKLPHAILFEGQGSLQIAQELSMTLLKTKNLGTHPDFHEYKPESKSGLHAIETLRGLIDEVHAAPFASFGKVFLIHNADKMQTASANALLKTLEEPDPDTTLILLTEHAGDILPTIRSRCVLLSLRSSEISEESLFTKALFRLLSEGPSYPQMILQLEKIEALLDDEDPVKKNRNIESFLTTYLMWHRDQQAIKLNISVKDLFFPEIGAVSRELPSLEKVLQNVDESRLALQRNIKLSACLERMFL